MESDSEETNEAVAGAKNINECTSNTEIGDVPEHHRTSQEIPNAASQSNIEVGNNESDEIVVEAKRRRKSPPVQIRY